MNKTLLAGLFTVALLPAAQAQFTNGNFETGTLAGWTVTPTANGRTALQQVVQFDVDGPGGLGTNFGAQFSVGQVVFTSGVPAGIELTQLLNLSSGVQYTFDFDWAATRTTTSTNAQGGIFDLIVGGTSLANAAAGSTSLTAPRYGHLTAMFTPTSSGAYAVGARIQRPFTVPSDNSLLQTVDNFTMSPVPEPASMAALGLGVAALLRRRRK